MPEEMKTVLWIDKSKSKLLDGSRCTIYVSKRNVEQYRPENDHPTVKLVGKSTFVWG